MQPDRIRTPKRENGVIGRREGRRLSLGFLDILIHPSPLSLSPIGSALDSPPFCLCPCRMTQKWREGEICFAFLFLLACPHAPKKFSLSADRFFWVLCGHVVGTVLRPSLSTTKTKKMPAARGEKEKRQLKAACPPRVVHMLRWEGEMGRGDCVAHPFQERTKRRPTLSE